MSSSFQFSMKRNISTLNHTLSMNPSREGVKKLKTKHSTMELLPSPKASSLEELSPCRFDSLSSRSSSTTINFICNVPYLPQSIKLTKSKKSTFTSADGRNQREGTECSSPGSHSGKENDSTLTPSRQRRQQNHHKCAISMSHEEGSAKMIARLLASVQGELERDIKECRRKRDRFEGSEYKPLIQLIEGATNIVQISNTTDTPKDMLDRQEELFVHFMLDQFTTRMPPSST